MQTTTLIEGNFVTEIGIFAGQVEIINGLITRVSTENLGVPDISFKGQPDILIFPGFGDIHVHAREDETGLQNYKETYDSCQQASLNGGVVHISAMPNTPNPLTSSSQLEWHKNRCKDLLVEVFHYVGVGPETQPIHEKVPYKVYTGPSVGSLFFKDEATLRKTLQKYVGLPVSFHVEDYDVLVKNSDKPTHDQRRPISCVTTALKYVLKIIEEFSLDAKLCHWSCGDETFTMIEQHRSRGHNTTIEVSPLHLYFDTDMTTENPHLWPYLQMNPSLQSKKHRIQLIEALRSGFIDYIATDHAPHTLDEKFKNFGGEAQFLNMLKNDKSQCQSISIQNGHSGTPQLDTYGLIVAWLIKEHHFTPQEILRVACINPGNFVNKFIKGEGKYGRLQVGYFGSFTVLDLGKETLVTRDRLGSAVKWSPFENITFPGAIPLVVIKGNIHHLHV